MSIFRKHLPNFLSALRLVLIIPFIIALSHNDHLMVIIVAATIVLTDFLDGQLARAWHVISETGKILDPLADKVCTAMAALSLVIFRGFPLWLLILIAVRDFAILIAGVILMKYRHIVPVSDMVGRITMGVVAVCLLIYLFALEQLKMPMIAVTVVVILASAISYGHYFYTLMRQKTD
jgi:CDP-diacylglycerol--glycerol-3-phosphate 3-phosphatidyltransferase